MLLDAASGLSKGLKNWVEHFIANIRVESCSAEAKRKSVQADEAGGADRYVPDTYVIPFQQP